MKGLNVKNKTKNIEIQENMYNVGNSNTFQTKTINLKAINEKQMNYYIKLLY